MGVSKVIYGNTPVMDITDSTVTPQNLLSGEIAYGANGNRIVGTAQQNIADGVYAIEKKVYTGPTAISETTYNLTQSVNDYSYIRIDVGVNPEHINGTFAVSQLKDGAGGIIVLTGSNEWFSFSLNAAGTVLTVNDIQSLGNNREIYGIYAVKFIENDTTGPIEYIESTGTQYIDTGVKAIDISKIVVDCSIEDTPGAWGCIFGSQGDYTTGNESFILTWNNSKFNFRCGTSSNEIPMLSNVTLQQRYVFECTNSNGTAGFSVDETSQGTTTSSTLSSILNVWLFKNNANTTVVNQVVSMKLYSCKIYNTSDTLIADYKPYVKNGEACLYNEISNTYLMNIGTGDFIAGPEITPTSAGHTILDNSGTPLPAEPNLQLKGVYTHDDSTNETTVAEITRVMTSADYNLLSEDEKQGVIVITDEGPDPVYTDVIGTLAAGETSITLGSTAITPTSTTEVFTDTPDIDYNTKELIYTPSVLEYTVHFTTTSSMIAVTLKDAEGTQISQDIIKYYEVNGENNAFVLDGLIKLWYDQPTWKIRTLRICTCDNVDYNINDIVKSWDYSDSVNFDVIYNELSWAIRLTYDARQTNLGVKVRVS